MPYTGTLCQVLTFVFADKYATEVVDAILDYPTWYNLTEAFGSSIGNLSALVEQTKFAQANYHSGGFGTGIFLENQDQPRFQSLTQDQAVSIPGEEGMS